MRYYIVINPVSGTKKGEFIYTQILPILQAHGTVVHTAIAQYSGHPYALANTTTQPFDAMIVIGGDGTMHEIINGMLSRTDGRRFPIGLIPAGTGNSLMHDMGILDPKIAAHHITKQSVLSLDLAQVQCPDQLIFSFNVLGWGLPVSINKLAEKWRWMGGQRYNMASLFEIIRKPVWPVKIQLDTLSYSGNFAFLLACNTKYSGNGMLVAPRASMNDGLLDVILFKKGSRMDMLRLFSRIFDGRHIESPLVEYHQVRHLSIEPDQPDVLNVDGQLTGWAPVQVTLVEKAIEIFGPQQ